MVAEAAPEEEDIRPYLVRKMNLVLGVSKAVLVFEYGDPANVETLYTTGVVSNAWHLCATARPV
jgi:hypothetical protein